MSEIKIYYKIPKTFWCLAIIGLTLWAQHAWVPGFFQDGYLYAAFGKNAAQAGHWLLPHLSDSAYPEFSQHTPFTFILEGLFFKIFGSGYTQARIFAVFFTFSTFSLIYYTTNSINRHLAFLSSFIFILIPPLIKKTRFPNMDLPLMFWIFLSLLFAFVAIEKSKKQNWIFCGVFFGLALLTKGPIAFAIPMTIFFYLLVSRKINILISLWPWLGLVLGLAIFSIWPLSLYLEGRMDIFLDYYKTVFVDTAVLARGQPSPFYTYFKFFLVTSFPWFVLGLLSVYLLVKQKINFEYKSILIFLSCYFFPTLLILSFAKFKYSHYLIPLYPAMSIMAGISIMTLVSGDKVSLIKQKILLPLALVLPLFFVIFPVGTEIKRDPEIFKTLDLFNQLQNRPDAIGLLDDAYPFYSLANLMGYHHGPRVFVATLDTIKNKIAKREIGPTLKRLEDDRFQGNFNDLRWSFILKTETLNLLKKEIPNLNTFFSTLIYFKKIDMYVLIERPNFDDVLFLTN